MTRYLTLGDYLRHNAQRPARSGVVVSPDLPSVWAALLAPATPLGNGHRYHGVLSQAMVQTVRLIRRSDADPSDDPVTLACLRDFIAANGGRWQSGRDDLSEFAVLAMAIRSGKCRRAALLQWMLSHVRRPTEEEP
ncbi:MAG TPA: hypothetical protein VM938_12830 [Acidimicrobiales bacterium]|nr:hypothetical protein [Acidimicrobiales bacterium]